MNILILASQIGQSASGLVIEKLVNSLSKQTHFTLYIICNEYNSSLNIQNVTAINQKREPIDNKYKINLILLNKEKSNNEWVENGLNAFLSLNVKIDGILTFGSAYGFKSFSLAYAINKSFGIPYWLHALDPIPSTPHWGEHRLLRFALTRYVKKFYKNAVFVSASNDQMIEYQLDKLNLKKQHTAILNPTMIDVKSIIKSKLLREKGVKRILFIGSLYEKRNPRNILTALKKINNKEDNFTIDFYGSISDSNIISEIKSFYFSRHLGFCDNVSELFKNYDVLLDIDADIPNDVFISSKLSNYLVVDLPILAITPKDSPSRVLMADCNNSVICCSNDEDEIADALLSNIINSTSNYHDRELVRHKISIENITSKYVSILKKLYSN